MGYSQYLGIALGYKILPKIVKNARKFFKKIECDSIAVTGMSGSLVAPLLAVNFKKNIVLIRRTKTLHADDLVEYEEIPKKYIIVDDFIATGETVEYVIQKIKEDVPSAVCVGIFLYGDCDYSIGRIFVRMMLNKKFNLDIKLSCSDVNVYTHK